jgi:hypothetical protein
MFMKIAYHVFIFMLPVTMCALAFTNNAYGSRLDWTCTTSRALGNKLLFAPAAHNPQVQHGLFGFPRSNTVQSSDTVIKFIPPYVTLNRRPDSHNLLFRKHISHIATFDQINWLSMDTRIILASDDYPDKIFFLETKNSAPEVMVSEGIKDGKKKPISGISALAGMYGGYVCAAVNESGADCFGTPMSGIALIRFQDNVQKKTRTENFIFQQPDTQPTVSMHTLSSLLQIEKELSAIGSIVDLWWSTELNMLYIALQVQTGSSEVAGAHALVAATIEHPYKLAFKKVIPDEAVQVGADAIIAARGSSIPITLHKIRTLKTSTGLPYLIVLGGNGTAEQTAQTVCALPLYSAAHDMEKEKDKHGMIAAKLVEIKNSFGKRYPYALRSRYFKQPVSSTQEMTNATDLAAQVGGGPLDVGPIEHIFIEGDAVYATVVCAQDKQVPGIFMSQPIFNHQGVIIGWTQWRRVAGITKPTVGIHFDHTYGTITALTNSGTTDDSFLAQTRWKFNGDGAFNQLQALIAQELPPQDGGVQGCNSFSPLSAGLADRSLCVVTGSKKIIIAPTGKVVDGHVIPSFDEMPVVRADEPLQELGMIYSVECAAVSCGENTQGLLFVGGSQGLAVLVHEDGTGWVSDGNASETFAELIQHMHFKKIGNYSCIRKLVYDRGSLYVLTDTRLDRIHVSGSDFAQGNIKVDTVVLAQELQPNQTCIFSDCVISEKLAVLGTSCGLFYTRAECDVSLIRSGQRVWEKYSIPGGADSVIKLHAMSTTGRLQDCTRGVGGMLYVLNGYKGSSVTYVHRFAIPNTEQAQVTQLPLQLLPDHHFYQQPSYYRRYQGEKSLFATDGSVYFVAQNRQTKKAKEMTWGDEPDKSAPYLGIEYSTISLNRIPLHFEGYANRFTEIMREEATGCWMAAGDFGLLVNE